MGFWSQRRSLVSVVLSFVLFAFVTGLVVTTSPSVSYAQPEGGEAKPDEAKPEEEEKKAPDGPIMHFIKSIGWAFGTIFLVISIGTVMLIVFLAMDLRMGDAINPAFVDDFTNMVNRKQFKQAYELCKSDVSFLAQILTAGMGRLQYGIEDAREAMFNQVDTVRSAKESTVTYLATVGTLGPLLGLVGTVSGMIGAFRELGETAKQANPQKLAGEISHALVVTLVGVAISVPAIFFFAFFKNRLTIIAHNTSNLGDDLLTQMYHNSKKSESSAPATQSANIQRR
jgi:biopolymer transport protein ExbB